MSGGSGSGVGVGVGRGAAAAGPVTVADPIPLKLRANDVVRHVVNVDSCFRQRGSGTSSTDFQVTLLTPIRNVLRVRMTSVELPAAVPFFTAARRNVTLRILYRDGTGTLMGVPLVIPDGNYDAVGAAAALNTAILDASGAGAFTVPLSLSVSYNAATRRFVFTGDAVTRFGVDPLFGGVSRVTDYGLGYYLGFSARLHSPTRDVSGAPYIVAGDGCADFSGHKYVFLQVNDYACVRQTVTSYRPDGLPIQHDFTALAKILVGTAAGGDGGAAASDLIREVVFPTPQNITRLNVRVVDKYGEVLDFCGLPVSFALEVLEVRNSSMYDMVRDGLAIVYRAD